MIALYLTASAFAGAVFTYNGDKLRLFFIDTLA